MKGLMKKDNKGQTANEIAYPISSPGALVSGELKIIKSIISDTKFRLIRSSEF